MHECTDTEDTNFFAHLPEPAIIDHLVFEDIEYPVFDQASVVSKSNFYKITKDTVGSDFVRSTVLGVTGNAPPVLLPELLDTADAVFNKVASLCGAIAIEHTWGLSPLSDKDFWPFPRLLPRGMGLVARVPLLEGIKSLDRPITDDISQVLTKYRTNNTDTWEMRDAYSKQFVYSNNSLVMTDVDPLLIYHGK